MCPGTFLDRKAKTMKSTLTMAIVAALGLSAVAMPAVAKQRHHDFFGDDFFENRVNCGQARYEVAVRGFTKVVTKNCAGSTYRFTGNRNGIRYNISVSARTGNLWITRR